jgi:hypothetical protein
LISCSRKFERLFSIIPDCGGDGRNRTYRQFNRLVIHVCKPRRSGRKREIKFKKILQRTDKLKTQNQNIRASPRKLEKLSFTLSRALPLSYSRINGAGDWNRTSDITITFKYVSFTGQGAENINIANNK